MSNTQGNDIAKPGLHGLVDAGSKAMKAKMRGKVTVIKLLRLKPKVEEEGLSKVGNVCDIGPVGDMNWDRGIKSGDKEL